MEYKIRLLCYSKDVPWNNGCWGIGGIGGIGMRVLYGIPTGVFWGWGYLFSFLRLAGMYVVFWRSLWWGGDMM